ncbi:hypothetical protein ACFTSF_41110 [Kribbella sp. NPDC056951]|uniref:Acyl carrier protein n=1 Tax=Kribbella yunnanensis TaxID=190194 RepID=A0ABN2J5Q2_9ACTN
MTDNSRQLIALLRAVARLALPAADQEAYLAGIGVGDLADELALEVEDAPQLGVQLGLTQAELDLLTAIDQLLDQMSGPGNEKLWRGPALHTDERWAQVRQLARQFLFLQGQ